MTRILNYVKAVLTLFLLVKVLLHFIPKNGFLKYISFFTGVVLVIGILHPLLQAFGQEDVILRKLQYGEWEQELQEISQNASEVEAEGIAFVEMQYEELSVEAENTEYVQEKIVIETVKIGGDVDE